ncbi:hypothetical protein AAC387_Pa08g0346 [Persea americana]
MGLHLVALAKLKFMAMSHGSFVTALLWPFLLKMPFARRMSHAYTDGAASYAFFFFRLRRIFFDEEPVHNGQRWERVLRLLSERVADASRYSTASSDEASLHAVTMLAL